ncbi:MAG TPA: phosphoribosyltransferase family protein [Patescibacteria group bacterium]|jgi:putative phosphoribosyl transferase|nr:phosphoribosyltransferase family protein [Patescibacteria group bacterium]
MYFNSRAEAGQKLADELATYKDNSPLVVALGNGGVIVGEQIARQLKGTLTLFLSEAIDLPGEGVIVGTVHQGGGFTYSSELSGGEIDDYYAELHGYIEDQKREKVSKINRLLSTSGLLELEMLKDKTVIVVSDGLKTGASLDAMMDFLKPVKLKRLIIATPVASVASVDRIHIAADEIHCLSVTDNYVSTNHYYSLDEDLSRKGTLTRLSNFMNGVQN